MTYWMNDEVENRRAAQNLIDPLDPTPIEETPGVLDGALVSPAKGFWHGVSALSTLPGDAGIPYLQDAAEPLFGDDAVQWLEDQRVKAHDITRRMRVDPATTGFVGQTLHGAASVITQATIGTLATGSPVGGAVAAGGGTGYAEYNQLVEQGVDPETAKRIASITAVDTGVGVLLPMSIGGGLAGAVAWGAGANVALGAAGRYDAGRVLEEGGYTEMAEHYKVLDSTAIATDLLMGAGFPLISKEARTGKAREANGSGARSEQDAWVSGFALAQKLRNKLTPEQLDAADVAARVVHEERDLSPGLHKTPESMNAHIEAIRAVEDAVANGKDPGDVNIGPIVARMDMEPDVAQAQATLEARAAVEAEIPAEVKLEAERTRAEVEAPVEMPVAVETAPVREFPAPPPEPRAAPAGGEAAPAAAEAPKEAATLKDAEEPGRAIPDKLADEIGASIRRGETGDSPFLQAGAAVRRAGGLRTPEEARTFVQKMAALRDKGLAGAEYQKAVGDLVAESTPKPTSIDPSDTAAVAKAGDIGTLEQAAVNQALDAMPDLRVPDPDRPGETIPARELLARLDQEIEMAKQDAELTQVAVACFMRGGI